MAVAARVVAGCVTLIVPPPSPMPGNELIPPTPGLIGAKDTRTGRLRCGVLAVHLLAGIGELEITVDLDEITNEDGTPAVTREQVHAAIVRHNLPPDTWPRGVPSVRSRFRVDGFELGQPRSAFMDGKQLMRDVAAVKEALGLPTQHPAYFWRHGTAYVAWFCESELAARFLESGSELGYDSMFSAFAAVGTHPEPGVVYTDLGHAHCAGEHCPPGP